MWVLDLERRSGVSCYLFVKQKVGLIGLTVVAGFVSPDEWSGARCNGGRWVLMGFPFSLAAASIGLMIS